jgi:hypothetical protein
MGRDCQVKAPGSESFTQELNYIQNGELKGSEPFKWELNSLDDKLKRE